jgi:uncharacterized membrane protein YobD (UPF0266 family)
MLECVNGQEVMAPMLENKTQEKSRISTRMLAAVSVLPLFFSFLLLHHLRGRERGYVYNICIYFMYRKQIAEVAAE